MFIDYTVIADWTKLVLPVISLLAAKFGGWVVEVFLENAMETLRNFGYTPPKVMDVWGEMIFRISTTRLVFLGSNVDFPGCILICSGFFLGMAIHIL